jgi:hypothetical protein
MENKVLVFLLSLFLLCSCNKNADCEIEVNQICLKNFNNCKRDKIYIEEIGNKTNSFTYQAENLTRSNAEGDSLTLKLNQQTNNIFKNGILFIINDTMKYKIDEIKMEQIDSGKKTMWGTIYGCCLKNYKLNDSLIESHDDIIIYKR